MCTLSKKQSVCLGLASAIKMMYKNKCCPGEGIIPGFCENFCTEKERNLPRPSLPGIIHGKDYEGERDASAGSAGMQTTEFLWQKH